jgi:hypothetical protein
MEINVDDHHIVSVGRDTFRLVFRRGSHFLTTKADDGLSVTSVVSIVAAQMLPFLLPSLSSILPIRENNWHRIILTVYQTHPLR